MKDEKELIDQMMKVSETNPDVILYMQALMESYEKLENELSNYQEAIAKFKDLKALIGVLKDDNLIHSFEEIINGLERNKND